jgi:hypothetical protein
MMRPQRLGFPRGVLMAAAVAAGTASACFGDDAQANVPVKEVVLYSSGVGYFEHFGSVANNAQTVLRFKTDQINDILKSLVLEDMDGGKVAAVTYPAQGPIDRTLKSFQLDLTSNPALADLLNQLRGAKVTIAQSQGGPSTSGTVLGVEKQQRPAGAGDHSALMDVWIVNLVSDAGIEPIDLSKVSGVKLDDPELQKELTAALTALSQARDKDKKPVEIHFAGQGDRRVRIGYVVETPVWKTSYRLILTGKDKDAKAALQGWAIVENQTDSDWKDVQLSLVSGRPISFIEDLYQPLYVQRPTVVPELYASLRPPTYDDAISNKPVDSLVLRERTLAAAPAAKAGRAFGGLAGDRVLADENKALAVAPSGAMDAISSISSIASASKVGELFQYTVGSVSIARQQSAMLPIVTDAVDVQKLSIYNASTLPHNPLLGARLKNTTGKFLMQGPITVIADGAYAGDASVQDIPIGQDRLISYGIDQEVTVQVKDNNQQSTLVAGKIVKGMLELSYRQTMAQSYVAEDKSDTGRTLIIESPRHGGWDLIEPKSALETTDALYRFEGKLVPKNVSELTVMEQHIERQSLAMLQLDLDSLMAYSRTGEIPQPVRDAIRKAADLNGALTTTRRDIEQRQQKINEITQEQSRIRENMKSVNPNSSYSKRLLQELDDQETTIQNLHAEIQKLQAQANDQQKSLEDYLANLTVG